MLKQTRAFCAALALLSLALGGCAPSPAAREAKFLASGKAFLAKTDYARAVLEFKNAAQAMPKDAEPHYQLGMAYLDSGDRSSAFVCFRQAAKLDPKHMGAQLRLAEMMASSPRRDFQEDAVRRSEEVLALAPDNVDALNALAIAKLKLGDPEEAEKRLLAALRKAPANLQSAIELARVRLSRRDVGGAEAALRQAVAEAPNSAPPLITLGEFYLNLGRTAEAEQQFQSALKVEPKNGPALFDLAMMQTRAGQHERAERSFRLLSEIPDRKYRTLLALYLFSAGKREDAVAELEKLAHADPGDRDARRSLVRAYLAMHRTADAENTVAAAITKNGKDVDALLDRSKIFLSQDKFSQAQADLNQVVRFQPYSAEAHYLLSKIHQAQGNVNDRERELRDALRLDPLYLPARVELSRVLIGSKAAAAALKLLDEAPPEHQEIALLAVERNWALLALGRHPEARAAVDRMLATSRMPEVVLQDAILKVEHSDFTGARKSLEEALARNPADLRALELLVRTYFLQKQDAAGIQRARELAARSPGAANVQEFLGRLLVSAGKPGEARKAFEAAKAADPDAATADLALAELDIAEGKLDTARRSLSRILASSNHSHEVTARLLSAAVEEKAGNPAAAIDHYRKALEQSPRDLTILNNLAYTLGADSNALDQALSYAQRAKELAPDHPAVADTLGWIYYRKGLYTSAIGQLEIAVAKEPTARRRYHLAMAYLKAGDYSRGRESYNAALKLDPRLPEAKTAGQLLAESGK